ncbi:TetR/AcrR family transcriptional regulator [Frankia sp. AiPs1]|uniref:TetR/AcrR family transcriptional regulator n=1 Tax=Frankia sp. AiPs1 TaxID=573493 RepID=UPI002044244D|nr:TetR/AcrR family transcriptional regulator [Frankia sp. AiPs1]MCM3921621.1 TetR/AcrR family transcriptional regulator [Frankia sp. AiPs1]
MAAGVRPAAAHGAQASGAPAGAMRALGVDDIVAAALRVGTHRGFAALTMRALAEELGVSAMAAYHHVPSKDALVDLVIDAVLADVVIPPPDHGDWDVRLRELRRRSAAALAVWPGVDVLVYARPPTTQGWRIMDGYLQILLDAGLTPKNALLGFNVLHDYGMARSIQHRLREGAGAGVPSDRPAQWPALSRVATMWSQAQGHDLTAFADTLVVDGLRALLARQRAATDVP